MGLFGGDSSSSSKTISTNRKEIISGNDESLLDLSGVTGPLGLVKVTGSKGGVFKSVVRSNTRIDGLRGDEVASIIGGISALANNALGRLQDTFAGFVQRSDAQQTTALQTLADTTRSATGTESEAGRIVNKLITPALIALGLWLAVKVLK